MLATGLVGAVRKARRRGVGLAERGRLANEALCGFASGGGFVTGEIVRIDNSPNRGIIVRAGHPLPILVRDGRAESVPLPSGLPLGATGDAAYEVKELVLHAGDGSCSWPTGGSSATPPMRARRRSSQRCATFIPARQFRR